MLLNGSGTTETNCTLETQAFSIVASPIAFEILSSRLYANPQLAIVRELLTNAYDSHKVAVTLDIPIKISFPNYMKKDFTIRDYGTGLSKEEVMGMYTTFFSSTKSNSNDLTGCFGLGSKTPFSYTSSFSVTSYFNGMLYRFMAIKKDGLPSIIAVKEEETTEPNGLEVSIPTDHDPSFLKNAKEYLKYMPEILVDSDDIITKDDRPEPAYTFENILIYSIDNDNSYRSNNSSERLFIKQGQNVYEIHKFAEQLKLNYVHKLRKRFSIVVEVPIGTLDITPSREALSKDEENNDKIIAIILTLEQKIKDLYKNEGETLKVLDPSVYLDLLSDKYYEEFKEDGIQLVVMEGNKKPYLKMPYSTMWVIDEDGSQKVNGIYLDDIKYVIFAKDDIDNAELTRLRYTLMNHNEDVDKVYLVIPRRMESLVDFAKNLKRLFKVTNSMEEFPSTDIEFIGLSRFRRLYPNSRRPKSLEPIAPATRIYNHSQSIPLHKKFERVRHRAKSATSISYIKSQYDPKKTLIIGKDLFCHEDRVGTLLYYLLYRVKDKKRNNFTLDFLKNKKNLDIDLYLNTTTSNFDTLTLLFVAKTNIRFFKEYPKLKPKELFNLLNKIDWVAEFGENETANDMLESLSVVLKALQYNFTGKTQDFIKETDIYKQLGIIMNSCKREIDKNNLTYDQYRLFSLFEAIPKEKLKKRLISYSLTSKISKVLDVVRSCPNYSNFLAKLEYEPRMKPEDLKERHSFYKGRVRVANLSSYEKTNILRILKGEKNVVLLP